MMKTGLCPKCGSKQIIKIKDIYHTSGGGNISRSKHIITNNKCARITFVICGDCGFVEEYLDKEEIQKILE